MFRPYKTTKSKRLLELAQSPSCTLLDLRDIAAELAEREDLSALEVYLEVGKLLESAEENEHRQSHARQQMERQRVLHRRQDGFFDWPSTDAPASFHGFSGDVFFYKDGLLSYVGYRVGHQGEPQDTRLQILDCVFHNDLPRVQSPDYMTEWGSPKTAARLQKMADTTAAFTRNAKRNLSNDYSDAIMDWESDLEYLFREYYISTFGFAWPENRF